MAYDVDSVVIGAGVVGLAIARELALAGREVLVAEQAKGIGTETSSRNSEVIHAGLYYPAGSLKARLCVEGRRLLYAYCAERGIAHKPLGKLLVAASPAQVGVIDEIIAKARANGVTDLVRLTKAEALAMEPALRVEAAIHSPSTGIVDSHALMLALQGDAQNAGASFAFATPMLGGRVRPEGGFELRFGGEEATALACRELVIAAGNGAPGLARSVEGVPASTVPRAYLAKGNYFTLRGRAPFTRLVYPVPEPGGLGIHLTLDLGGQARFGPDVEWVETMDYPVDPQRADRFYPAIRLYWPGLPDGALEPGYSGIRPKIVGPGEPAADFRIDGPEIHGVPGLVALYGIESPGLTASLAIARHTASKRPAP
jgi:L-2-hydroxyglutarate oxidase LhgO